MRDEENLEDVAMKYPLGKTERDNSNFFENSIDKISSLF